MCVCASVAEFLVQTRNTLLFNSLQSPSQTLKCYKPNIPFLEKLNLLVFDKVAAKGGDLDCLIWAREHGCKINVLITSLSIIPNMLGDDDDWEDILFIE